VQCEIICSSCSTPLCSPVKSVACPDEDDKKTKIRSLLLICFPTKTWKKKQISQKTTTLKKSNQIKSWMLSNTFHCMSDIRLFLLDLPDFSAANTFVSSQSNSFFCKWFTSATSVDWLTGLFASFVVGYSDNSCFGFKTFNWKPLYVHLVALYNLIIYGLNWLVYYCMMQYILILFANKL